MKKKLFCYLHIFTLVIIATIIIGCRNANTNTETNFVYDKVIYRLENKIDLTIQQKKDILELTASFESPLKKNAKTRLKYNELKKKIEDEILTPEQIRLLQEKDNKPK